jgi:hypothetical protein
MAGGERNQIAKRKAGPSIAGSRICANCNPAKLAPPEQVPGQSDTEIGKDCRSQTQRTVLAWIGRFSTFTKNG